ncbi:MAG: HAD family hydrolase [Nitrososphaerales archaeon]
MRSSHPKPKLVIFDLDGTILNLPINYDNLRKELKTMFKPFGVEMEFKLILDSIKTALSTIRQNQGTQKFEEISMNVYRVLEKYETDAAHEAKVISGAEKTLAKLKQLDLKLAIFSRTGRSAVVGSLKTTGLEKYFDLIMAREDTTEQKPSSEGLEKILTMLGVKSDEAIVVGDHIFDIMAAKEIGIKSIAIQNEKMSSDAFKEAGAYAIVNNISEIPDKIYS